MIEIMYEYAFLLFWTFDFERKNVSRIFIGLSEYKNKLLKTYNSIRVAQKRYNFAPDAANHTFFWLTVENIWSGLGEAVYTICTHPRADSIRFFRMLVLRKWKISDFLSSNFLPDGVKKFVALRFPRENIINRPWLKRETSMVVISWTLVHNKDIDPTVTCLSSL